MFALFSILLLSFGSAEAKLISNIPELGLHARIVEVEKSVNRQHKIAAYTRLNENCDVEVDANGNVPVLGFHWLTDGWLYEPIANFWLNFIRGRLEIEATPNAEPNIFYVKISDLKGMKHDLEDPRLEVRGHSTGAGCDVDAFLKLGKSDGEALVRVKNIYVEASLFTGASAVTIVGEDALTDEDISRRYVKK
jgi:hypothetical protein